MPLRNRDVAELDVIDKKVCWGKKNLFIYIYVSISVLGCLPYKNIWHSSLPNIHVKTRKVLLGTMESDVKEDFF